MALQHLRSSTANKRPTPAGMSDGQLALNTNDASPGLFFKDSNGALVKVGPVHVGTTAPNATPGSGGSSGNAIGEQWLDTTGGTYVFKVWDGSAWRSESGTFVDVNGDVMTGALGIIAGTAGSPGLYFSGDTNTGLYSPGADQVAISTGGSGRLFVDASGNVGVGTSPSQRLHVVGGATTNPSILLAETGGSSLQIVSGASDSFIGTNGSTPLRFGTAFTERMRLDSSGRLGVGTSAPSATLHVVGTGLFTGSTQFNNGIQLKAATQNYIYFDDALSFTRNGVGDRLTIDSSGRVGVGTTTVDKLLTLNDTSGATLALKTGANTSSSIHGLEFYDRQGTASFPSSPGQLTSYVRSERNGGNAEFSLTFGTTNSTSANASERLRIDSSGRVGIGTSSPSNTLHVVGTGRFNVSGANNAVLASDGGDPFFYTEQAAGLKFGTNSAVRMTINSSGSVGIGSSTPGQKFVVNGTSGSNAIQIENSDDANRGGRLLATGSAASGVFQINSTSGGYGITLGIDGNEAVRVDTSRRLLVGTSSTSANSTLVLQGQSAGSTEHARLWICKGSVTPAANSALGEVVFGDSSQNPYASIGAFADAAGGAGDYPSRLVFSTTADGASSPTERMRINSNGAVGTFTVDGVTGLNVSTAATAGTTTIAAAVRYGATAVYGGTISFQVYSNGNVQNTNNSYGAISDIKLKENIVDANSQWSDIKALQVRNYNLKEGQTHTQIGLVAQEVEQVSPGLVYESPDLDDEGNDLGSVTKSVNYSVLYMKAVKALQEAMERIEQLEQRLAAAGI